VASRVWVEAAFAGVSSWRPFVHDALAMNVQRLSAWLTSTGTTVEDQFVRRGLSGLRPRSMPLTTSPGPVDPIRDALTPRRCAFKNRERLNRLLMLVQLHANRGANERSYTKTIRDRLEANHGRPAVDRRARADLNRIASLR
jgi:hypothetical protein